MTGDWYKFADQHDIAAHNFYCRLISAKGDGDDWSNTWVKVPRKLLHNLTHADTSGEPSYWWTGFQHVRVYDYQRGDRIYLRLPQYGEASD